MARHLLGAGADRDRRQGLRHEWWIYSRLATASDVRMFISRALSAALKLNTRLAYAKSKWLRALALTPEKMLGSMLKKAGLPGRKTFLAQHPHGVLLDDNRPGNFLGTPRVMTDDNRVNLAPAAYIEVFRDKVEAEYREDLSNRDRFKLFGKREIKTMNSWLGNSERLVKDDSNYAYLHPDDATAKGLSRGDIVVVHSRRSEIEIALRISDEFMPRSVAIPHGWGHGSAKHLQHARRPPGINSNLLAGDGADNTEKLSGMSHLSGILVDIERKDEQTTVD